jgi:hypothetical protein
MTIPAGFKILYKGYRLRGDVRTGMSATVPFIGPWDLAFTFVSQLLPAPFAPGQNFIQWTAPAQLPISLTGRANPPLYCQSWECVPCGTDGTAASFGGLPSGDFFTTALVTAEFSTPDAIQQAGDDPNNLNQLDPSNPITACEQSIQQTAKVITRKGAAFTYASGSFSGKPVPGEIPLLQPEVRLILKFPRIPMLPWQLLQPFVGKINSSPILNCATGSLLLEECPTVVTPGSDGSLQQNLGLSFQFNPDPTGTSSMGVSWNVFPCPDGTYAPIQSAAGGNGPYTSANFSQIFQAINF